MTQNADQLIVGEGAGFSPKKTRVQLNYLKLIEVVRDEIQAILRDKQALKQVFSGTDLLPRMRYLQERILLIPMHAKDSRVAGAQSLIAKVREL